MSKTYLDQVSKTKALIEGLRKHYDQVKDLGVTQEELSKLESAVQEGEKLNAEVERLRAEASEAVSVANHKLAEIKEGTAALKRIVKLNIDMNRWMDFGVPDKR